jgi:hypothetical protein
LTTAKILINSVISTFGAKFLVKDINNFYLNTPLGRFEYMVINVSSLPQETIEKYDLIELSQDGKVYREIQKGMYGLPQAGILANELLKHNLAKDGYRPIQHTHGLWTHNTRPISFSLVVDDFGVKYVGREHAEHLMPCIKKKYNISSDWNGGDYCGLTLEWEYKNAQSTYLCQDISKQHYINTNILPRHVQNKHHIRGIHPFMVPKRNLWMIKQAAPPFPTNM